MYRTANFVLLMNPIPDKITKSHPKYDDDDIEFLVLGGQKQKIENLKILIIYNFFSCHSMVMKLCTVVELGNRLPKLKSNFL